MSRYSAIVAYDGTAYQGFQRQPAPIPTIQAELESALERVSGREARVIAAGRTDAGVHAAGQVIAFDLSWRHSETELIRAFNAYLPTDIALQRLRQREGFHPRFDALWRQYAYRIALPPVRNPLLGPQVWQLPGESLDMDRLNAAAAICLGEHDFAAFGTPPQAGSTNTRRQVFRSSWGLEAGEYGAISIYRIRATAFLYHMVRRLVGAMVEVGKGRLLPGEFEDILLSGDINQAKVLAPPAGLVMEAVGYPAAHETELETREFASALDVASLEGIT